jgi:cyclopropane fatty-acyl-phospholipid synthase-like methyltransferase
MALYIDAVPISVASYHAARPGIGDPNLEAKLFAVPGVVDDWLQPFGGLAGKRILDFGCGAGEAAAAIALGYGATHVHGVDLGSKFTECPAMLGRVFGASGMPSNLQFSQVRAGSALGEGQYDVVISWSCIEHVSRETLQTTLTAIHTSLRQGGVAFIQISPLYFSPEGSHLRAIGYQAWDHLTRQTSEVLNDICAFAGADEARADKMSAMYLTLNRLTAAELVDRVSRAGFRIDREQRDKTALAPPDALVQAYSLDALTTEQIVLLLVRD